MNLINRLLQKLNPAQPVIASQEGDSNSTTTNYNISRAYYELDVVNRGVNLIVDACAEIPLDVSSKLRNVGIVVQDKNNRMTGKRLAKLLNYRPNPYQNADSFKRALFLDLLIEGNIFIYFDGMHLFHLPASSVEILTDKKTFVKGYKYASTTTFTFEEVIHIKENSLESIYRGDSRLISALPAINLLKAMSGFQENFFKNNAVPGLVLKTPNTLSSRVKERILAEWASKYNPKKGGKRPAILDGDMSIESLGHTDFRELDFKESILTQEKNILKALGVPPLLLDSGNNANISPNQKLFYTSTILPIINKLVKAFEFYFGYDIKPITRDVLALRPEMKDEGNYISSLVNGGIITPNEGRDKLRYGKISDESADQLRIPANIAGSAVDSNQGGRPTSNNGN